ncbi:MAG: glycerol-3-phosphate acyltransferase [Verrucomicrobia bacterium]|nr:glycerol-3-phosphate acyltransferase [Verrucomicrobiota bacterium]
MTVSEGIIMVACYVVGCFTTGYYYVRWRTGWDIRQLGSGTVGARNVGRVLGGWGFGVTLLADAAKGALAVGMAAGFGVSADVQVACVVAVVAGHNWPVQLRFRGGKGVSTSLGAILAYDPFMALVLGVLFLPALALLRSVVLGGMVALTLAPLVIFWCKVGNVEVAAISFVAILVVVAHARNIREEIGRLHAGRVGKGRPRAHDKGAE